MSFLRLKIALLVVAITFLATSLHAMKRDEGEVATATAQQLSDMLSEGRLPKNVIFDLTSVLFGSKRKKDSTKESTSTLLFRFLSTLDYTAKTTGDYLYREKPIPAVFVDFQAGVITHEDVLKLCEVAYNDEIDENLKKVIRTLFGKPGGIARMFTPIDPMIAFLQEIAEVGGDDEEAAHQLYLLSNLDSGTLEVLREKYPDVFDLFTGIVISGQESVNCLKPDEKMYQHLLDTYNLDPEECFFIDDQEENITAAYALNINGVQYVAE